MSQLFGLEKKLPSAIDPDQPGGAVGRHQVQGRRHDDARGELTATITARVVEVLPNGDLVLEGVREIDINGDRQIVVLTGVAAPADIDQDNVVLSTAIGQLRIRYFGRGLIKDNLRPAGWFACSTRSSDRTSPSRSLRAHSAARDDDRQPIACFDAR